MTLITREHLAQRIHAQPTRLVLAVTGGGSRGISSLTSVAGASRSILSAVVPYASEALVEWLGGRPDEFCASWTARAMAMTAYLSARRLAADGVVCGVACTASLASDRPKRGVHRAYLAWQSASTTAECSIELEKGARTRNEEEDLVCDLLLNLVAEATGIADRLELRLSTHESRTAARVVAPVEQQDLLAGRADAVEIGASTTNERPAAVLPGAFHPLHEAHREMAGIAGEILGHQVAYEMSIANVDKPPLDFLEIDRRVQQFSAKERLWLTRAPLYVDKAALFPGATFVVGADTIARIGATRYYASAAAMESAIGEIASRGCDFLVFGRQIDGVFRTLADLSLPGSLAALCRQVPENRFHVDLSSTELRRSSGH
jgi:nicotinamide mononucleotide (NMN) deamidase PncC